jgi:hypothetical protein
MASAVFESWEVSFAGTIIPGRAHGHRVVVTAPLADSAAVREEVADYARRALSQAIKNQNAQPGDGLVHLVSPTVRTAAHNRAYLVVALPADRIARLRRYESGKEDDHEPARRETSA